MADQIEIEVPVELDGERVDKALASLLEVSRAVARSLVDDGVTVDGSPAKPSDRVSAGSAIISPRPGDAWKLEPEPVAFDVLLEDDDVLVVAKPAGVVVHPGSGRTHGTLAAGLLHRFPDLRGVGQVDRWGLVHRLDKDTSGVLVVGRTHAAYESLTGQLRRREMKREYVTLVNGLFGAPTGAIDAPIGRDPARPTRRAVAADGKPAVTHYEVARSYPNHECSLLDVRLETGRTHQIRVHLAAIDHPVIGDETYGVKTARVRSPRVFLHASRVEFQHPSTARLLMSEAPLPEDLASVLASLDN